ncbi:DnaJ-domain-containing protein [Whalleya microplaca]|nr:DnaJ-domain-containing protein [Whalleya microplaca]
MAPSVIIDDYYAVLGVARTADADALKAAWRRLARIKHPDKNPGNPTATAEFQLLESAYSTLCDPARRKAYDLQFPPTFTSNGPAAGSYYHRYASTANNNLSEQEIRERESKRDHLHNVRRRKEADVFEARRSLNRILEVIKKLDEEEKRDVAEESTWWGYFTSMIPGSQKQREERTRERDRRALDRLAARRIKDKELERQRAKVTLLEATLQTTQAEITKITLEINKWREEQAAARRREAQRQQEEHARRERARRKEEEAEAARRAAEWEELWRREQEEAAARLYEELRRAQREREREREEAASCTHRGWWKKVDGPHTCSNCSTRTTRFALQCPQCKRIACASCRKVLQVGGQRDRRGSRRGI